MRETLTRPFPVLALLAVAAFSVALALVMRPGPAAGVSTKVIVVTEQGTAPNNELVQVIASCPSGFELTGGGYEIASINPAIFVHQDTPLTPEINEGLWGWAVTLLNDGTGGDVDFSVQAVCWKN